MYLSDSQYENIKENVVDMYEECGLTTYPIDCMEIARRLNYRLVPYSKLKGKKLVTAMNISMDGFHMLVEDKVSGMFMWVIFIMMKTATNANVGQSFMKLGISG